MFVCLHVYLCRIHKPEVPHGPASQQKLSLADDVVNDAQLLGRPKYLTTGQKDDSASLTGRPS